MSTMEKSSDDHESLFATDGPTWTWHHIFGLTMPSFSGSVNVYETGSRSRPPLPLDKLLEGHPPVAAESPLFARLPIEVLTHVLSFLPADALLSFAMVNSDCRQIARSVWFETVVFDYDFDSAFGLSEVLGKELSPPRLGACVRRLVVATNRGYFQWLHGIEMQSLQDLSEQEKERKLQTAADIYFGYYIPLLTYLVGRCLPNLELLDWRDKVRMGPKLIHTVLMSPILHLRLNRAKFDKDLIEAFKNLGPGQHAGTLQTLDIELASEDLSRTPKGHSFDLVAQILKYCSSSLRTLRWNGYCTSVVPEGTSDVPEQLPTLPNIRDLTLSMLELRSPGDMEALLPLGSTSKLLRLELDHPDQYTVQHMNTMTAIPTLKELAISGGPRDTMPVPLSFFEANPQLELLSIESDQTDAIDNKILPLLASCFHNLISLEIEYAESKNEVSGTTLHYISQLKSLEKLHLQAGHRYGWKRTWVVDHPAIRQCVAHLPKLKYLALSRDTYHHDPDRRGDFEGYYTRPYLLRARNWAEEQLMNRRGAEEFDDFLADSALEWRFELIHRRRMLIKAYKYIHLRYEDGPHLEFLYFGELPMKVVRGWRGFYRPMAVSDRRDDCYTFLRRTFRGQSDLFAEI